LLLIALILFRIARISSVRNNRRRFTHSPFDQFDQGGLSALGHLEKPFEVPVRPRDGTPPNRVSD